MRKTTILLTVIALGIISNAFLFTDRIHAQEDAESIRLMPAVDRPSLSAGEKTQRAFTVVNDGKIDYSFAVYARPYSVDNEQYDPNFTEVNENTQAYLWVDFEKTTYRLEAGQQIDVPYSISAPPNAAGGGHYAVIFAETQPDSNDTTNVLRKKRVGSLLYMTVDGQVHEDGSLESWNAGLWQKVVPITSLLRLKNGGNVHFPATIDVTYSGIFGRGTFNYSKEAVILPGTTRSIPIEWVGSPSLGIFKMSGTVAYLGRTETLQAKYVVLLPLATLFGILATTAGFSLLTVLIIRRRRRRARRRHLSQHSSGQ